MAKTAAQRQAERRARIKAQGLQELRGLFVTETQAKKIRDYAKKLQGNT